MVSNTKELEPGLTPSCEFTEEGGVIGSSPSAFWVLQDQRRDVQGSHCEILVYDNHFCVKDLSGKTYVNGATMPVGVGKMAQITTKDSLKIGVYELMVVSGNDRASIASHNQSLEQLFTEDAALVKGDPDSEESLSVPEEITYVDPLDVLDGGDTAAKSERLYADEEEKLSDDQIEANRLLADEEPESREKPTLQADSEYEISSAIKLKKRSRFNPFSFFSKSEPESASSKPASAKSMPEAEKSVPDASRSEPVTVTDPTKAPTQSQQVEQSQPSTHTYDQLSTKETDAQNAFRTEGYKMDDKTLDLLEEEIAQNEQFKADMPLGDEHNHLLSGPLFRGLGVSVTPSHQSGDVQMTSEEMGAALQAAVRGLLDLHQHVDNSRYGVINKNLQPIEDNPLRLGLSYEDTVKTLFNTSPGAVHLSAPSAISESLKNQKDHNDVVQMATTLALGQIVRAFSPEVLMKRFENYRRSYQTPEQNTDAWAWEMYRSYYKELTSDRQQGFEKLFWEVFDQAYDRLLREKQMES
nr:type VI secretion system-associated FHA domain protein TagH [Vibrio sp. S9_S30]